MKAQRLVSALIGIFFLFSAGAPAQAEPPASSIRIGISTALTGNAAPYGVDMRNVFLFANEKLANNQYTLIFDDDRCNGKDAVAVAHRFIDILRLPYAIGFACSSTVFASAALYEKAQVPVITTSASAAGIAKAGDFIFRTWPSDAGSARRLRRYVALHQRHLGILSEQTDYAQAFLQSFIESNSEKTLPLETENFLTDQTDFRSSLLKLKNRSIDALFINSQTELTFLAVLKQVRELNWNIPLYAAFWPGSAVLLETAKGLADGVRYVDAPSANDVLTAEGKSVLKEFTDRFGRMNSIEMLFATSYEGFRALHQAIQSGQDIRGYLYRTTFHGIFGDWSFDSDGEIKAFDFVMKVVRDNKPEPIRDD